MAERDINREGARPHLRSVLTAIDDFLKSLPRGEAVSLCESSLRLRKLHKELRAIYPGALFDLIEERVGQLGMSVDFDVVKPYKRRRRGT